MEQDLYTQNYWVFGLLYLNIHLVLDEVEEIIHC
jgi:hypothetical protein